MPCSNCTITFIQAGLEYPDGSYANANTSLWLHHTVLIKLGTPDTVCGFHYYAQGQRWFASGNERTPASLSLDGTLPAGFYLGENESHLMLVELMNQAMYYQEAVLTFVFEWVPGKPDDFYSINPIWLDIAGCPGYSDMPALSDTSFSYSSPVYNSTIKGALIGTGAHLHDGGVYANMVKNDTVQCQSQAFYGQTTGYWVCIGFFHSSKSLITDTCSGPSGCANVHGPRRHGCTDVNGSVMCAHLNNNS